MIIGMMFAALLAAVEPAPVAVVITNAQPAVYMSRAERTKAMREALKVDEAEREARRYERQRKRLQNAAGAFYDLGGVSNKVIKATVDFETGDILVLWADGSKVLRRFDEKSYSAGRKVRPAINGKKKGGE